MYLLEIRLRHDPSGRYLNEKSLLALWMSERAWQEYVQKSAFCSTLR